MEMNGHQIVLLPQQQTWNTLNDIEALKACIPG